MTTLIVSVDDAVIILHGKKISISNMSNPTMPEVTYSKKGLKVKGGWGFATGVDEEKPCNVLSATDPNGKVWFGVRNQDIVGFKKFIASAIKNDNWGAPMSPVMRSIKENGIDAMVFDIHAAALPREEANAIRDRLVGEAKEAGMTLNDA